MCRLIGIVALVIFFIWGQGFASGWVVFILSLIELLIVAINKLPIFQCLIGLCLLGITFFAPPTFGYSELGRSKYEAGYADGKLAHDYYGGIRDTPDDWWEGHAEKASVDISNYKKFYIRGFKRGLAGKSR